MPSGSRVLRWMSAWLLAIASSGAGLVAAEEGATKTGLQSARRDYEALKAADARSPEQKAGPRAELPLLEAAPPSASDLLPKTAKKRTDASRSDPRRRERSSNWLLEAMRDETETHATSAEKTLEQTLKPESHIEKGDLVETALALEKQQAAQRKSSEERQQRVERHRDASGLNPLDSFMASWMSSKDLELLGRAPTAASPAVSGIDAIQSWSHGPAGAVTTSAPSIVSLPVVDSSPALTSFAPERTNPYLENLPSFAPAESATPVGASTFAPAVSDFSGPARQEIQPAANQERRDVPSERFRPQDDAKYFKQLKRF